MNKARVLHEASQLAIKGKKSLVACPSIPQGRQLAEQLLGAVASNYLLYEHPCECTYEPIGSGWSVRFKNQGEVFFSPWFSSENRYFDFYFSLRPVEEIRNELKDQGLLNFRWVYGYEGEAREPTPLGWESAKSLVQEDVRILSRYERIRTRGLL